MSNQGTHEAPSPAVNKSSRPNVDSGSRSFDKVHPQRIGEFRIIRQIGRGGMGIVYEAEQLSLRRHVALKLLPRQMLLDERQRHRFDREARAAANLHHTNIVPVYAVGESDGVHYYAMQFIEGLGLDDILREVLQQRKRAVVHSSASPSPLYVCRKNPTDSEPVDTAQTSSISRRPNISDSHPIGDDDVTLATPLRSIGDCESISSDSVSGNYLSDSFSLSDSTVIPPGDSGSGTPSANRAKNYWQSVADIGLQVAAALQYAHQQGVFHRDIKPSNLLLDTHGTIWVLDFGLAKSNDQHELTHTGDIVGTLRYMPPEAFEGKTDARSDIYSLGLTLYEMLALRPAFGETQRHKLMKQVTSGVPRRLDRLDSNIPRDLVTIVHKAIDRDPKRRYQTAEELADDLNRYKSDKPIRARRTSTIEHAYRWARRNRALSTSLGLIALLLITINIVGPILTIQLKQAYDAEVAARRGARHAYEAEVFARERADEAEQQVRAALDLAMEKEQESSESLNLAEQRADELRRTLYRAEINLAGQAANERTGINRLRELTDAWRPKKGEDDLRDWEWFYLQGLGHLDQQTIHLDGGNANAVAWHPNGLQIALGRDDGTVEIWDLTLGRAVFFQKRHHSRVLHVCWNPDGSRLASIAAEDNIVRIWDPANEKTCETLPLPGPSDWYGSVSFNRNGQFLAADGRERIAVWNLQSDDKPKLLSMPRGIAHVAWSPTEDHLAAASKQDCIKIWDAVSGEERETFLEGSRCLAWGPQGQRLAFAGLDCRIHVLDLATGEKISSSLEHVAEILTLAWEDSGMRLASAGRDTTVRIWDPENGAEIARFRGHASTITALDWKPNGGLLVSAGQDQTIKIWKPDRADEQLVLHGAAQPVLSTSWGARGGRLAASSGAWTRIWNVDRPEEEAVWQGQRSAFHPTDERIAIATQADIQIRNSRTGKLITTLKGHDEGITSLFWDPEGKRIASASWDGTARIWDVANKKEVANLTLPHHDRRICWSPDGIRLAMIGNRDVQIWDMETRKAELQYQDADQIHAIAWSPDGKLMATSGWSHQITIWNAFTGETVLVLTGHTSPVTSLCWNPTGTRLASGSEDQVVRIWDVKSRGELLSLRGHNDGVTSVCWSSDGMRIASGDRHGCILVWDATSGHLQQHTEQALSILNRRIQLQPSLKDLILRAEVLETLGESEAALKDQKRMRMIRESDFEELTSDPVALGLLTSELSRELHAREAAGWTDVIPLDMTADNGATLTLEQDNSIYVTGPSTAGVKYEISAKVPSMVTALRLEAIPDSRLPHGGSGRASKNGNFHIAELNVFAASSEDAEAFVKVPIVECADSMPNSPEGRRVIQTIDGNRRTLWDPYPNHKKPHWAVYQFVEPIPATGGKVDIRIQVDSGISRWGPHGLGRFRISVTEAENAVQRANLLQLLDDSRDKDMTHLGGIYSMLGQTQHAGRAFANTMQNAKDHVARQAIVAMASQFSGVVEELLELLPRDPWVKLKMADSLAQDQDAAQAYTMRTAAIDLLMDEVVYDPQTVLAAASKTVDQYQAREDWVSALNLLERACQSSCELLAPDDPIRLELLGKLAMTVDRMGQPGKAMQLREREVDLRKGSSGMQDAQTRASCRALAKLLAQHGKVEKSIDLYVQIAEAAPLEDINASQQAAFFLVWRGDVARHQALCQTLLETAEGTGLVKAERDFSKAVAICPNPDPCHVERAVTLATHAMSKTPSNMWGALSLGMVHYRHGDVKQADKLLTRATEATTPQLRMLAQCFLAMLRHQQQDEEQAAEYLNSVEEDLGELAFEDVHSPMDLHHDDLATWLALQELRRMMQCEVAYDSVDRQ